MLNIINKIFSSFKRKILFSEKFENYKELKKIFSLLENKQNNKKIMFVGGCIRKLLNNEPINDIDAATNLTPEEVKEILVKNNIKFIETGLSHGTITIVIDQTKVELTTLRKDVKTDGRHANVEFISDWEDDASRRDFTINAIYSDFTGKIYDPLNGSKDLKDGIVKFIGDPNLRINEDYLRILRYLRFFTQYSKFDHDYTTLKAVKKNLDGLAKISKERIIDEFLKILSLKNLDNLFNNKDSCSILLTIFPQLKYYERLKKRSKISKTVSSKIDNILLLSIMLIDNSDSTEFFLYKFRFSNKIKNRIYSLYKNVKKIRPNELLNEEKIIKLSYFHITQEIRDLLIFFIFVEKKIDISMIEKKIEFLENIQKPIFPIEADFLKSEFGFSQGRELGDALKKLEKYWIDNNFNIEKKQIKNILNL